MRRAVLAAALIVPVTMSAQSRIMTDVDYRPAVEQANKKDMLDIYLPENARNAPVIVSFFGGALRAGEKSGEKFVGRLFSAKGFITVVPNYRLSPDVSHPAHVEDAAAAVAWVRNNIAKYGGDSASIVVIGHSAGAYLAALLTMDERYLGAHQMKPSELRGVVPVSAFFYVERSGVAPDRPKDVWGVDSTKWRAASPASYLRASGVPPLLLLYADGDDPWRRQQQSDFASALKQAGGRPVATHMIAGRTHNTVWSKMASGDEETSKSILDFIATLPRHAQH
ncbi:MAG: alpha/beta hydrolase [Gemmatimonadota bacterium]